jgi:hypothetical protein
MSSSKTARNSSRKINRRGVIAVQIPAQLSLNQSRSANHASTAQISFGREMHVAACSNCPAETAADFVIAQINMGATSRTNCGCRRTADLLLSVAIKTLDYQSALSLPEILQFVTNRGIVRGGRFFFYV